MSDTLALVGLQFSNFMSVLINEMRVQFTKDTSKVLNQTSLLQSDFTHV